MNREKASTRKCMRMQIESLVFGKGAIQNVVMHEEVLGQFGFQRKNKSIPQIEILVTYADFDWMIGLFVGESEFSRFESNESCFDILNPICSSRSICFLLKIRVSWPRAVACRRTDS
jgi:hypothetical protein